MRSRFYLGKLYWRVIPSSTLDFFNVRDSDWAILFENASIRVFLGFTDSFFDDVSTFDDNLAFDSVHIENGAFFAFVVTGDDFYSVTFVDVGLNTHIEISVSSN